MASDVPLKCSCGALRGVAHGVSASAGNRLSCYCDDCQSFAHFLGHADQILDAHGGTDLFQLSQASIELTDGAEQLACVQLRPGGLMRWYAKCCRTPVGNTLRSRQVPFMGLIHGFMDHASGPSRDEVLGASRGGVNARFAVGDRSTLDAHDKAPASMLLRIFRLMLLWRLRGDHKRSPFFAAASGEPCVVPHVLSAEELAAAEKERDAR